MSALIELKTPKERFARSINVERDAGSSAIDGYLPVGRAVDAIARIARAVNDPSCENAFSITGPYGSGKSSLAVLLDALFAAADDPARASAQDLIADVTPDLANQISATRKDLGAHQGGFIRAVVTAQREPVIATVLRALLHGVDRYGTPKKSKGRHAEAVEAIRSMHAAYTADDPIRPDAHAVKTAIASLAETAPVLLLIDEFGKNLEAFADSHSDADLYLLQELAEATRGENQLPLVLVTLQHLAFDEYSAGANLNQRREWAKIQGRFEDIPFVGSAIQTQRLIAAAFKQPEAPLESAINEWANEQTAVLTELGVGGLDQECDLLGQCWPLHPIALAILPELCERYGQNERTLFSFLASSEPGSVATYLRNTNWRPGAPLPSIRLDKVYDYFLESAANLVGVSNAASRWVEIDTRIRDAHGLQEPKRRVLKAVGLLNMVSAGGTIRASKAILEVVCADGRKGTATPAQVRKRLGELEKEGLVTYRDYVDEFRVWAGSDFDLKSAIDIARRRLRDGDQAVLLERVLPMGPLVAARHFHQTGTLRAFARKWINEEPESIEPLGIGDREDGTAFYVLGSNPPHAKVRRQENSKPVAFVTNPAPEDLVDAALEVAALDEVLGDTEHLGDDWVARRELAERRLEARLELERQVERLYGATSESRAPWAYLTPTSAKQEFKLLEDLSASQAMSAIADDWYADAPVIRNDLVNRHDLSSQLAKARRMLVEAMIGTAKQEHLGIEGSGPDKTLYRTTLEAFGLHRDTGNGWEFAEPTNSKFVPTWEAISRQLSEASTNRIQVDQIYSQLASPPLGIRRGIAPIFLIAAIIVHVDEIALYENGTFRPRLDNALIERLLRNPQNFELKHFASRTGSRATLLVALTERLDVRRKHASVGVPAASVLRVVSHLVSAITAVPRHIQGTKHLSASAVAVRNELLTATEPDELLFKSIPKAFGLRTVSATANYPRADATRLVEQLADALDEIIAAYPTLLERLRTELADALRAPLEQIQQHLAARAAPLDGQVINPNLKKLVAALTAKIEGDEQWIEYVAMNIAGGTPPQQWDDGDRARYSVELRELADTFLRLEWLNADLRTKTDGFDALRVAVTRSDGNEHVRLVPIDHGLRPGLEAIVERAVQEAQEQGLGEATARDALIALLADAPEGPTTAILLSPETQDRRELGSTNPEEDASSG